MGGGSTRIATGWSGDFCSGRRQLEPAYLHAVAVQVSTEPNTKAGLVLILSRPFPEELQPPGPICRPASSQTFPSLLESQEPQVSPQPPAQAMACTCSPLKLSPWHPDPPPGPAPSSSVEGSHWALLLQKSSGQTCPEGKVSWRKPCLTGLLCLSISGQSRARVPGFMGLLPSLVCICAP